MTRLTAIELFNIRSQKTITIVEAAMLLTCERDNDVEEGLIIDAIENETLAANVVRLPDSESISRHETTILIENFNEWELACTTPVSEIEERRRNARRAIGRYSLEEAAQSIYDATGERADVMLSKLTDAALSGALPVYEPEQTSRYLYGENYASRVREFYEEAYWNDLNAWLEKNETRIAYRFPTPDAPAAKVEAVPVATPSGDDKPWLVANPSDPEPDYSWYTPARYFARQLVKDDSTLLVKKEKLAEKTAASLSSVGIFKRGNKKKSLSSGSVLKSFVNVALS